MKTDIHFVPSYVCLKQMLSMFNVKRHNIVFVPYRHHDLQNFLGDIFKTIDIQIVVIPSFNPLGKDILFIKSYVYGIFEAYFKHISDFGYLYFYCDEYNYEIFLLIEYFKKRTSAEIVFFNAEPGVVYTPLKGWKYQVKLLYVGILNIFSPVRIKIVDRGDVTFKWLHEYKSINVDTQPWRNIAKKFQYEGIQYDLTSDKSILLIHQDLRSLEYVDYEKTVGNLIRVLLWYERRGYHIFVKPHPGSTENIDYLNLVKNIHNIPGFIPVEFLNASFDIYLTYFSLGIAPFLEKECYSLKDCIQFKCGEQKSRYDQFINENLPGIHYFDLNMV